MKGIRPIRLTSDAEPAANDQMMQSWIAFEQSGRIEDYMRYRHTINGTTCISGEPETAESISSMI